MLDALGEGFNLANLEPDHSPAAVCYLIAN